jgi:hypothetical protein
MGAVTVTKDATHFAIVTSHLPTLMLLNQPAIKTRFLK